MDGFHQMRIFQRVLFKRFNCIGLQKCKALERYERIQGATNCSFKYYRDEITNGGKLLKRCINFADYRMSQFELTLSSNITQHAERQMLKLIFVLDHINSARYNSFQHVFLSNLSKDNP